MQNMFRTLVSIIAYLGLVLAVVPSAMSQQGGMETPEPCPEGAEKVLLTTMIGLSTGQYENLGQPYGVATAAVGQCPDNGIALSLAASLIADIGMRLGNAQSDQAPRVLAEAFDTIIAQDNAPAQAPVTVQVGQYDPITYTTENTRTNVDEMLKKQLLPVLVGASRQYEISSRFNADVEACPYSSRGQIRALREAEGIVSALGTRADGFNHEAPLSRLETLRINCQEQTRPLAMQEMKALMDMSEKLTDLDKDSDAACLADKGRALIEEYRANAGAEESEAANLRKLEAWDSVMKSNSLVVCPEED